MTYGTTQGNRESPISDLRSTISVPPLEPSRPLRSEIGDRRSEIGDWRSETHNCPVWYHRSSAPTGAAAQKLGFPEFPFFEVRVLLLRNIVAAKPMVRFGCPKHQKVYQGHKKVPCEFRTRPQPTRNLPQLPQPSANKKWKPLAPHQLLKKSKNVF